MIFNPEHIELSQEEAWFAPDLDECIGYGQILDFGVSPEKSYISAVDSAFDQLESLRADGCELEEALQSHKVVFPEITFLARKMQMVKTALQGTNIVYYMADDDY